ncbi:unnamed protein product [Bemisia tabaci]|uniref:G protein pathway suppressor 2 n=2 Tax=Bemisia tabaci TaxID=7038 RepID=A0A9P0F048_BEMTA|nr:unnamed protein product [Bemisia tabaci]
MVVFLKPFLSTVKVTEMPAVVVGQPQRNEAMWPALKAHITRERQKKKQEQEADAEEERQRKAREKQAMKDGMTLAETREEITLLENKLARLKDEKHQLFLQLKKVLNEDDNRRRQIVKETNAMMGIQGYPVAHPPPLFLQQNIAQNQLYKVPASHSLLQPSTLKRPRSPSPPPSAYRQGYSFKPAPGANYQKVTEDTRHGQEYVRAVLWNKGSAQQYGGFYGPTTTSSAVYTYGGAQFAQPPTEAAKPVYIPRAPMNQSYIPQTPGIFPDDKTYYAVRPPISVQQGISVPQAAKSGAISGYPVRPPNPPASSSAHGVYASQAGPPSGHLVYTQAGPIPQVQFHVPKLQ